MRKPKPYYITLLCLLLMGVLNAQTQHTYKQLAGDTIIIHKKFMNTTYLLDGKKLNPVVMEWFMSDHPQAYEDIRISIISEQVSTGSYAVGALFLLASALSNQDRPQLANSLRLYGGLGVAGGILFQVVSGKYRQQAVNAYNYDVRQIYQSRNGKLEVRFDRGGVSGVCRF